MVCCYRSRNKEFTENSQNDTIKIRIASLSSLGRAIFIIMVNQDDIIHVMLRQKSDKKIDENMTIKNKYFKDELNKNLDMIFNDMKNVDYKKYDTRRQSKNISYQISFPLNIESTPKSWSLSFLRMQESHKLLIL